MKALRIRFMCEVGNGYAHGYVYRGDAEKIESKKYSWKTRVQPVQWCFQIPKS